MILLAFLYIQFSRMVCSTSVTRHIQALGVYLPKVSALDSYIRIIHFIRIFLMFHNVVEEEKNLLLEERSIGRGNELDDFQIADLKKRYEYKKRNHLLSVITYYLIYSLYFVKITSPKRSSWPAIHSCTCDGKLTITSQQKVINYCFVTPSAHWYITNFFHQPTKCTVLSAIMYIKIMNSNMFRLLQGHQQEVDILRNYV